MTLGFDIVLPLIVGFMGGYATLFILYFLAEGAFVIHDYLKRRK